MAPLEPGNSEAKSVGVRDQRRTAVSGSIEASLSFCCMCCSTIDQSVVEDLSAGSGGVFIITKRASVLCAVTGR